MTGEELSFVIIRSTIFHNTLLIFQFLKLFLCLVFAIVNCIDNTF